MEIAGKTSTQNWPHNRLTQMGIEKQNISEYLIQPELGMYLIEILFQVGPTGRGAMGDEIVVTWERLAAYNACAQSLCEEWEFLALIGMSLKYLEGRQDGSHVLSMPPWERQTNG